MQCKSKAIATALSYSSQFAAFNQIVCAVGHDALQLEKIGYRCQKSLNSSAFHGSLNSQNNLAQDKSFITSFVDAQRSIGCRKCSLAIQESPY